MRAADTRQQAVEKALKAFLTWHDRPFRKTHDLVELGAEAVVALVLGRVPAEAHP